MFKLIFIATILACLAYGDDILPFVKGNLNAANTSITQWFKDHTPEK